MKPGYKFAGTDDTMVSVGYMKDIVKTQATPEMKPEVKKDEAKDTPKDAPKDEPIPADAKEMVKLSVKEAMPGDKVEFTASGLDSTKEYTVWFRSTPVRLDDFHAGGNNTFTATFTVPANAEAGVHHVVLTERGSTQPLAQAELLVKAPAKMAAVAKPMEKKAGEKLAQTGTDVAIVTIVVLAAILGSAGIAFALRNRR